MTSKPAPGPDRGRVGAGGHMVQLDGLRAIAALSVVLHHTFTRNEFMGDLQLGTMGVRLFFVLSGFLITGILLANSKGTDRSTRLGITKAFYARRCLRIFPLYYATVLLLYAIGEPRTVATLPWHLLYCTNGLFALWGGYAGPPLSHLWSLAVEEQFYLVWPWLILFMPTRWLRPFLIAALFVGPLSRLVAYLITHNTVTPAVLPTSCIDTLGAGAYLAWLRVNRAQATVDTLARRLLLGGLALLAACKGMAFLNVAEGLEIVLTDVSLAMICLYIVNRAASGFSGRTGRLLELRPLVALGVCSYGIYLFHHVIPGVVPVIEDAWSVDLHYPEFGILRFGYTVTLSIAMALVSWHCFEKPINSLKSRFPYRR